MTDRDLLAAYTRKQSHDAFAELVRRHVHLVHSAALRQARGDAHLADDITQAVFIVLSRRAETINDRVTLPGWLICTTRYATLAALKAQSRRRRHEEKAAAMTPESTPLPEADDDASDLAGLLDDALARLPARLRAAVTLRYLQNKSSEEVAVALGISEPAARKRVGRGLDKLRARFARRGISTPSAALESLLSAQSTHAAPKRLVALLSAPAFDAAAASAAAASIAAATTKTLATAHAKFVVATSAAALTLAVGIAIPVLHYLTHDSSFIPLPAVAPAGSPAVAITAPVRTRIPADAAPADTLVRIASADFKVKVNRDYQSGMAVDTLRGAVPVAFIKSTASSATQAARLLSVDATPYRGQRLRLAVFAKTVDVRDWAGLQVTVYGANGRILADDDMGGRPIHGTTDWQPHHVVVDVPPDAITLILGANIRGPGELWTDDFLLESVPPDTPTTDDTHWHLWSPRAAHYAASLDPSTTRDGRPALRVSSTTAPPGSWVNYDRYDRDPAPYLGRRIRMTAWVKSQNMNSTAGLLIRVLGPGGRELVGDQQRGKRPVRGTSDWTLIEASADVPPSAQAICTGITMNGRGTLWFDDVRYEVIDSPTTSPTSH